MSYWSPKAAESVARVCEASLGSWFSGSGRGKDSSLSRAESSSRWPTGEPSLGPSKAPSREEGGPAVRPAGGPGFRHLPLAASSIGGSEAGAASAEAGKASARPASSLGEVFVGAFLAWLNMKGGGDGRSPPRAGFERNLIGEKEADALCAFETWVRSRRARLLGLI